MLCCNIKWLGVKNCANSPEDNFIDVTTVVCFFSTTPIVCACFMVSWRTVIPRTSNTSCITFETETELLSVIITVGKYACLVRTSMIRFAVLIALRLCTGYTNAYIQKTSIGEIMFS